jgi:hypothetical protein
MPNALMETFLLDGNQTVRYRGGIDEEIAAGPASSQCRLNGVRITQ